MTDVETMNNRKLDELAKGYAEDILAEVKKNGGDAHYLAHEYANGSQWVCYYDRAHELCRNCDIDDGEEYAGNKQPHAKSYNDMAADIAYGELHARILRAIDSGWWQHRKGN
jgi:hypothetical protein